MSWWRWTCSERGACSFNLPRLSSLWGEETLFLSVYTFFWGLFSSPTLFAATSQQPTCSWFPFSAEQKTFSFSFWAYGIICGWPRPVSSRSAKLPGWRSPPPIVTIVTIIIAAHRSVGGPQQELHFSTIEVQHPPGQGCLGTFFQFNTCRI